MMLLAVIFVVSSVADASRSKSAPRISSDQSSDGHIVVPPAVENSFLSIRSKNIQPSDVIVQGEDTRLAKGKMCMWGSLVFLMGLQWTWHSQLKSSRAQILNRLFGCLIPLGVIIYLMFWTGLVRKLVKGEEIDVWCTMLCIWAFVQVVCGFYLLVVAMVGRNAEESSQEDPEAAAKAELMALPFVHREAVIQPLPPGQWEELTWVEKLALVKKRLPTLLKEERRRTQQS